MKRKVVFVGGPLDGKAEKIREDELVAYLSFENEGSGTRHFYRHCLQTSSSGPLRAYHRYVFMGYKPRLPSWLKKEMKQEGGNGE